MADLGASTVRCRCTGSVVCNTAADRAREAQPGAIYDSVHVWLEVPHQYTAGTSAAASGLLIVSSAVIDSLGIFLLLRSILGPTVRPFLGLLILFAMRQICQLLCALEPPHGMIWYDPGFPTLLVTYGVATDFFFSGHTGLAVLGAVELVRMGTSPQGKRRWLALGIAIAVFEATTVLVLRAHYTMDVFTGAVVARYASILASRISPPATDSWTTFPSPGGQFLPGRGS